MTGRKKRSAFASIYPLSIVSCGLWATAIKKTLRASERERADVALARAVWQEWQKTCDPSKLVFLDETGATAVMTRQHGRSLIGERCHDHVPGGHWKTTTFIGGLRVSGMTAQFVLEGAGEAFLIYIGNILAPALKPGDIIVMDNLSSHKVTGVRERIEARGAKLLYLPPYSPDLNPIEQAFSKLKAALRKAAERSIEELWKAIGRIIKTFLPGECKNYFANSGYVLN